MTILEMAKKTIKETTKVAAVEKEENPMLPPGSYLREHGMLMLVDKFDQEKIMPLVAAIYEYNLMPEDFRPDQIT